MLNKIFKYVSIALFVAAAVLAVLFFAKDSSALEAKLIQAEQLPSEVKVERVNEIANNWHGTILNFAMGLLIVVAAISVLAALYRFVKSMIESRRGLIANLVSIGIIALVIILGYSLASEAIPPIVGIDKLDFEVNNEVSKRVGTGLYIMYLFFGLAILGAVYTEISKMWK
jgi:MFS family permease